MTVRVRFAPSPTGELHIGGARTALFNWLYARNKDGKFLLRIEDTDRERSSDELTERIIEGLQWLGLDWDEEPLLQSTQKDNHIRNVESLMDSGAAYRCFCDPDKLKAEREAALKSGARSWKYPGYCRDITPEESEKRMKSGDSFAVRFRVPEGKTVFTDMVHSDMEFDNDAIDDFIIVRSDGTPTYQLSVVSDDISMGVTDIIRGDDHISNTPKQILIYNALGKDTPRFAHIPLILGPDKKRLSKRHGATSLLEYREKGYLPEALFNFISLLGWSPGDDTEKMAIDELVAKFTPGGINKSGAVFDEQKLEWLNGQYLSETPAKRIIDLTIEDFKDSGLWQDEFSSEKKEWFEGLIDLIKTRCRMLPDFVRDARPYICDDFEYDEKGIKKHLKGDDLLERLERLAEEFSKLSDFTEENTEEALRKLADDMAVSAAKLIHPLRMALVGVPVSPGIFEVAVIFGKDKTISRIRRLIDWLKQRN